MTSSTRPRGSATAPQTATRWAPTELGGSAQPGRSASGPAPEFERPITTLESEHTRGYEEGLAAGLERGRADERERLEPVRNALEAALDEVREGRPAWLDNLTRNVQTLAVAVARQVIQQELKADPSSVHDLVANALSRFPVDETLTIRLNPADLSALSASALEGQADPAAGREIRWRPDPQIDRGSCVVEGPQRMVDGRVDKALFRIYHALMNDD